MISKGSLVQYKGTDKRFYTGQKLMVHERKDDKIIVYNERTKANKWTKVTIPVKDVEEVC